MSDGLNAIFDSEGWLLTTNERGLIKVGVCDETETCPEEEFIEVGYSAPITIKSFPKICAGQFFISDLHIAEKQDDCFRFKGISFSSVLIHGVVTHILTFSDKSCIIVDDGMSCIKCLVRADFMHLEKDKVRQELHDLYALYKINPGIVLQSAIIMKRNEKLALDKVPGFLQKKDLAKLPGKHVKVWGNLRDNPNNRYIFIEKITFQDDMDFVTHLEHLQYLYENVYSNREE